LLFKKGTLNTIGESLRDSHSSAMINSIVRYVIKNHSADVRVSERRGYVSNDQIHGDHGISEAFDVEVPGKLP